MIDPSSLIAVGLAAFCLGMAYGAKSHRDALRSCARSRVLVVDDRAYLITALVPAPGYRNTITIMAPQKPSAAPIPLDGGEPEDAA